MITTAWISFGSQAPIDALFPGTVTFAALVVISALRLDGALTLFTGVLSGGADVLIRRMLGSGIPLIENGPGMQAALVLLVVVGLMSALVAEVGRRRTLHAIGATVARRSLERDVMEAADRERSRLGRDLHDGLGGHLTGLSLMAAGLARRLQAGQSVTSEEVHELAELASEGVEQTRRLARGLDPAPVDVGLVRALTGLSERTRATDVSSTFAVEGKERPLDHDTKTHLYHIAREAVTNALRHGRPSQVDIRLTFRPGTVALDIRDDGAGLPPDHEEGLGFRAMRQRASLLGTTLRIQTGPEGGTAVHCVLGIGGVDAPSSR